MWPTHQWLLLKCTQAVVKSCGGRQKLLSGIKGNALFQTLRFFKRFYFWFNHKLKFDLIEALHYQRFIDMFIGSSYVLIFLTSAQKCFCCIFSDSLTKNRNQIVTNHSPLSCQNLNNNQALDFLLFAIQNKKNEVTNGQCFEIVLCNEVKKGGCCCLQCLLLSLNHFHSTVLFVWSLPSDGCAGNPE